MDVPAGSSATHVGRTLPTLVPVGMDGEVHEPTEVYSVSCSSSTHQDTAEEPII